MAKHTAAANSYIAGIDGLRAMAVLSVVLYHLDRRLLPGGFTGVDVFFVISGYVISKSLAASNATGFASFIVGFYERRILRIIPARRTTFPVLGVVPTPFLPASQAVAHELQTASNSYPQNGAEKAH